MKLPTTTFKDLCEADACTKSYRRLAKALGGLGKYGRTTPITCLQILDVCDLEDLGWVIEEAYMEGDLKIARKLDIRINESLDHAYAACEKVWELYWAGSDEATETYEALDQVAKDSAAAEAKELEKQTAKLRKYLVKHGG